MAADFRWHGSVRRIRRAQSWGGSVDSHQQFGYATQLRFCANTCAEPHVRTYFLRAQIHDPAKGQLRVWNRAHCQPRGAGGAAEREKLT